MSDERYTVLLNERDFMKTVFQFAIILVFSFVGEILHELIPLPIPASVYGLVLLFVSLLTGIVKLPQVEKAADILIKIMPMMFIPAVVKMVTIADLLRANLLPIVIVVTVSTITVMVVTGVTAQGMICGRERRKSHAEREEESAKAAERNVSGTDGKRGNIS